MSGLVEPTPTLAVLDLTDLGWRDPELPSDRNARSPIDAYGQDLLPGQLRSVRPFTSPVRVVGHGVRHVLHPGRPTQMPGVYTRTVVTHERGVSCLHGWVGGWPNMQRQDGPVGLDHLPVDSQLPVSPSVERERPGEALAACTAGGQLDEDLSRGLSLAGCGRVAILPPPLVVGAAPPPRPDSSTTPIDRASTFGHIGPPSPVTPPAVSAARGQLRPGYGRGVTVGGPADGCP